MYHFDKGTPPYHTGASNCVFYSKHEQKLPLDIFIHALSQGALGIECRRSDRQVIEMINSLNDEYNLLEIFAKRTFPAKLESGCSAPVGVISRIRPNSICLEGCVLDHHGI